MKKTVYYQRIMSALASSRVFWAIVLLLIVQATWIALSGLYPMAFDENFHLGIIRLYAHHLSPFWDAQPAEADAFGAVARDPSYLYQYLMSFPYRVTGWFTHDQTIQVIVLRFINVGLFAASLPLYRRLLLKTGASRALTNVCFLVFVLVPVVPLLAAQINYDNLLLPLTALALLLTLRVSDELRAHKRLNMTALTQLSTVCLLTSLVKYAFLPIFLAIIMYLLVRCRQTYPSLRKFWQSFGFGLTLLGRQSRWLLLAGLLLATGLFAQRDLVNLARYHTPVPDCDQVLSIADCQQYGPWARNHRLSTVKTNTTRQPIEYSPDWLYGMWLRSFFAVDGPTTHFQTRGPLFLPGVAGFVFPALGFLAVLAYGRRVLRRYDATVVSLFLTVGGVYVAALWADGYQTYSSTGQPVAINGRYLFPVLLPLLLLAGLAFSEWLKRRPGWRVVLAAVVLLCLVWGGGALTYILRSNNAWYWPNSTVQSINGGVRRTLAPIVPGAARPTEFLNWH